MTNSVIKICNFVHYFFREGGYLDWDQFSLLLFSLFMGGGRVKREIVPNSLFSLFFYFELFPYKSGHGRYKCYLVQCDVTNDPWGQVPHNCGFHPDYSIPDNFDACGEYCRGAFCRCLKFYHSLD